MRLLPRIRVNQFVRRLVIPGLLLSFTLSSSALQTPVPSEYQVKAAFVLNFIKFVNWPPAAFETANAPISICILGDDPFGNAIDHLTEGETISGRRLSVQRLPRPPVPKSCHVLFLSKSEKDPGILNTLGPGVLTVSDRERFLTEGGMIALVVEDRRVRFDVNLRSAIKASLTMNARMLGVARSVQR